MSDNKLTLLFSKKQGETRGGVPKLGRWLHVEVQVTGGGRLLWFVASHLRSRRPPEETCQEGWTMTWTEAFHWLAPGLQRSAGRETGNKITLKQVSWSLTKHELK